MLLEAFSTCPASAVAFFRQVTSLSHDISATTLILLSVFQLFIQGCQENLHVQQKETHIYK